MTEFKDMLKYFRMREQLSQSELAEKIGVSSSTISMYEVGKREPDFETEEKIADFFNTDLNTLRGRDIEIFHGNSSTPTSSDSQCHALLIEYSQLTSDNKDRLFSYAKKLLSIQQMEQEQDTLLNAAHAHDNASAEDLKHDEDIMDDDNF